MQTRFTTTSMARSLNFLLLSSFVLLLLSVKLTDGAPVAYDVREDLVVTDPLPRHVEGIEDNVITLQSFKGTHETEGQAGRSLVAELDDYTPGANPSPSSTPPPVSL